MFCLNGEVVFIHSKCVKKNRFQHTNFSCHMWVQGFIDSVNPEFSPSDSKNEFNRTENLFPPSLRLALVRWPFSFVTIFAQKKIFYTFFINIILSQFFYSHLFSFLVLSQIEFSCHYCHYSNYCHYCHYCHYCQIGKQVGIYGGRYI